MLRLEKSWASNPNINNARPLRIQVFFTRTTETYIHIWYDIYYSQLVSLRNTYNIKKFHLNNLCNEWQHTSLWAIKLYPFDTFPEILIGGPRNKDRRSPKYPLVFPELSSSFPEFWKWRQTRISSQVYVNLHL